MNLKKIKCVALDFDNTMYSKGTWANEPLLQAKFLEEQNILPEIKNGLDKLKYMKSLYPNFHSIQTMYAFMHDNGIDDSAFRKYNEENISDIITDDIVFINPKIIEELSKKYRVFVISDSQKSYLEHYIKYAKIDINNFEGVYANEYNDEGYTKIPMMEKIINKTGLKPEEIVMVGDNEKTDIVPAKLVGLQTYHVKDVFDTEAFLKKLIDLKV